MGIAPAKERRTFTTADVGDLESGDLIVRCTSRDKYVTVLQTTARDWDLSFKAKGILLYLLSLPSDWRTNLQHLAKQSKKEGRTAIASGIQELITEGYARRVTLRDKAGQIKSRELQVAEVPVFRTNPVRLAPKLQSGNLNEVDDQLESGNLNEANPNDEKLESGFLNEGNPRLRKTDTKKNPEKKTPPSPPADAGEIEQLQLGGVGERQDEKPTVRGNAESSKPKSAATGGAKDPLLQADVAEWLRTFKKATEDEVLFVLGELDKKDPGEIANPKAYADRALRSHRAERTQAQESEDRLRRTLEEEEDPICRHQLRLSKCPDCSVDAEDAKAGIAMMLKKLSERMSA
jgi:hypothetical protein